MKNEIHDVDIKVRELHKSFGGQIVLHGINFELGRGVALAVLGRSGAGKSVLLRMIIGLLRPDSGSVQIRGEEITNLPLERLNQIRKTIGFLFQYSALYDSLTVQENVAFPLKRHTKMTAREQHERVLELLSCVGMEETLRKMPSELSGGMKKRVGLARALALDPDIMLFDEPTAGLDPITAGEINELIRGLHSERKISSIIVTHDMLCARTVSDRVAFLHEGSILYQGPFEGLRENGDDVISTFIKQRF